jgi:hypothetical protein
MLTMTTKQFRSMLREAGIGVWQCYTNPCAKEGARNVGAMLTEADVQGELQKLIDVMKKHGHNPEDHNIRITDSRVGRHWYGWQYIRGVAKYEE